jgi:hypothetical protein
MKIGDHGGHSVEMPDYQSQFEGMENLAQDRFGVAVLLVSALVQWLVDAGFDSESTPTWVQSGIPVACMQ